MALTYPGRAAPGAVRQRACRRLLGAVVWRHDCISYQPTLRFYRRSPLVGAGAAGRSRSPTWHLPSIPPISMGAGAAASGRAGSRPSWGQVGQRDQSRTRSGTKWRSRNDAGGRAAIGQGTPGREFPGGVPPHPCALPRADPGVLRIRAHRRRHRRPRQASRRTQARAARPAGGEPARHQRSRPRGRAAAPRSWPSAA